MKKVLAVVMMATVSFCAAALALAETDETAVKEKAVAKAVRQQSAKERMMPGPDVQLKRLAKGLQLSAEQQQQIRPILKDEYARLKQIRQDENLSPKQIQAQVEALRAETVAKIQAVLTPEQKETYDAIGKEIQSNKKKRMQENRRSLLGTKADPPSQQPKQ